MTQHDWWPSLRHTKRQNLPARIYRCRRWICGTQRYSQAILPAIKAYFPNLITTKSSVKYVGFFCYNFFVHIIFFWFVVIKYKFYERNLINVSVWSLVLYNHYWFHFVPPPFKTAPRSLFKNSCWKATILKVVHEILCFDSRWFWGKFWVEYNRSDYLITILANAKRCHS